MLEEIQHNKEAIEELEEELKTVEGEIKEKIKEHQDNIDGMENRMIDNYEDRRRV
jgi:DNA-binding transcriptional regulator GbsR (MarR family)